jgi:hypothetical protein
MKTMEDAPVGTVRVVAAQLAQEIKTAANLFGGVLGLAASRALGARGTGMALGVDLGAMYVERVIAGWRDGKRPQRIWQEIENEALLSVGGSISAPQGVPQVPNGPSGREKILRDLSRNLDTLASISSDAAKLRRQILETMIDFEQEIEAAELEIRKISQELEANKKTQAAWTKALKDVLIDGLKRKCNEEARKAGEQAYATPGDDQPTEEEQREKECRRLETEIADIAGRYVNVVYDRNALDKMYRIWRSHRIPLRRHARMCLEDSSCSNVMQSSIAAIDDLYKDPQSSRHQRRLTTLGRRLQDCAKLEMPQLPPTGR